MYINIFVPDMSSKALDGFARCGHDKAEEGIVRAAAGGTRSALQQQRGVVGRAWQRGRARRR
jgi:hypothetical protein